MSRRANRPPKSPCRADKNAKQGLVYVLGKPEYSRSLAIGVTMLQCFTAQEGVLGIADLAKRLGVARSTVHRYAATLVVLGWLEQNQERKYRLAPRSASAGMAALGEIILTANVEPVLRDLRRQTGYTVSLGVLDGLRATYVCRLPGHSRGQYEADADLRAGAHVPLHCTAVGKALLSALPPEDMRSLVLSVRAEPYMPLTIAGKRELIDEIDRVRRNGLAINSKEWASGAHSIAACVSSSFEDREFAVEVNLPSEELTVDELRTLIGPHVLKASLEASRSFAGIFGKCGETPK